MKSLTDFKLSRIVTRRGLAVVWYCYVLVTLVQLLPFIFLGASGLGKAGLTYTLTFLSPIFSGVAQLVLVRIFLEMASVILAKE
jgi:hypothetical protein